MQTPDSGPAEPHDASRHPSFRIVVATHGRPGDLDRLLNALVPQIASRSNFNLVVVNDGTHDEQYEAIIGRYAGACDYRVLEDSGGAARARQAGLADSEDDYLITTDDDCIPPADWVERTEALAVGFPMVDLFAGNTTAVRTERGGLAEEFISICGHMPHFTELNSQLVVGICAIMMFKRQAFERAGGFTEAIAGSGQDWNLTYKILQTGARYLTLADWTTGHTAETTLFGTLNRFYRYGFGAAQHVLHEQDWSGARLYGDRPRSPGTTTECIWFMARDAGQLAREAQDRRFPVWLHAGLGGLVGLCLRSGWHSGLRRHGKRYGRTVPADLTRLPRITDRLETSNRKEQSAAQQTTNASLRIVAATYKRPDDLRRFLEAAVPQVRRRPGTKLVIVNDASHSEAYEQVIAPYSDDLDYIVRDENGGPGLARNTGCAGATEDYIVFIDDDCIPFPDWLAWLDAMIDTYPEIDLFAGGTVPVPSDDPGFIEKFLWLTGRYPRTHTGERGLVIAVTANLAVRREKFEQVGGFDPDMRLTGEDWNLTYRLLETGVSYRVCNDWVVGHKADESFADDWRRQYNYGYGGIQHVLRTRDWQGARTICNVNSIQVAVKHIAVSARRQREMAAQSDLSRIDRLRFALLAVSSGFRYVQGWLSGMKHFSRKYGIDDLTLEFSAKEPLSSTINLTSDAMDNKNAATEVRPD